MASGSIIHEVALGRPAAAKLHDQSASIADSIWQALKLLGSLKITVTMFAFSILILFVGTLAQDEQTLIDVKRIYFNSWIAMVPHHVFAPVTIFGPHSDFSIMIPIPGGATIGLILLVNLIAAKATRFSMNAKGRNLWIGTALLVFGIGTTVFVILNAHAENGLQGEPPFSYETLWNCTVASVYLIGVALIGKLFFSMPKTMLMRTVLAVGIIGTIGLAVFFATYRIPDPGLRIVWQLFKSLIAGVIMLVGLNLLFGKRGGNVLIHLAVGLLMLGQFVFGDRQNEEKMILQSGETTNIAIQQDEVELAIVETLPDGKQRHVAVDQDMLIDLAGRGKAMASELLPFDIRVDQWMKNSKFGRLDASVTDNPATMGIGTTGYAREMPPIGAAQKGANLAAAYVSLLDKKDRSLIGTLLVCQEANDASQVYLKTEEDIPNQVSVDGKSYEVGLRYRRTYKPYDVTLHEVKQVNYSGTTTPRDFRSTVTLHNRVTDSTQDGEIWMNNPIRFDGETFYQSEFFGKELVGVDTTGLQVVTNAGWLVPYLACVFAGLGMFAHFGQTFVRFASRFDREVEQTSRNASTPEISADLPKMPQKAKAKAVSGSRGVTAIGYRWIVPVLVTLLLAGGLLSSATPKPPKDGAIDWYKVGQIPMQDEGRIMPLDSVARRFLQTLSGRSSTIVRGDRESDDPAIRKDRTISATEYLFALANGDPSSREAKIFRIDAQELRDLLGLDPRDSGGSPGGWFDTAKHRYSLSQLIPKFDKFQKESDRVRQLLMPTTQGGKGMQTTELTFADRKIMELNSKLNLFMLMADAYRATPIPLPPQGASEEQIAQMGQQFLAMQRQMKALDESSVAGIVPPILTDKEFVTADEKQKRWRPLNSSVFDMQKSAFIETGFDDTATRSVYKIFQQSDEGTARDFEQAVAAHQSYMRTLPQSAEFGKRVEFEAWYNKFNPFTQSIVYYSIAIVCALLSFVFARQSLRRTAFWICAIIFVVHTVAIITRIYISDRPPVINLYSSAVYIGWAAVLAGLIIEVLYPIRLGVLVGGTMGVLTLLVAWGLDTSDTMPVLQAVLDTQFWLTTHVQCITLGYAATFFAGFIAIYALIHRIVALRFASPANRTALMGEQRILYKLCYGIVCFGLFFSFIGTVLGGLWADDSWGRFWGWDPKENGALMIVMWNAILLHARWDRMIAERGFYLLAIGGNIITAWSWFGTNQLGIGLHSYGFTESVLFILTLFVIGQIAIIIAGSILSKQDAQSKVEIDQAVDA